jgi:hypothetical protein
MNFVYNLESMLSDIGIKKIHGEIGIGLVGEFAHPFSIKIIGGISRRGPTRLHLFKGTLEQFGFQRLLVPILIPFVFQNYPNYYRLHLDNARCHVSKSTIRFLRRNLINHFKTLFVIYQRKIECQN